MSGEQAIFNLEIKKKSGLSLNPDIHHSKVFSSDALLGKTKNIRIFLTGCVQIICKFLCKTCAICLLES